MEKAPRTPEETEKGREGGREEGTVYVAGG